MHQAGILDEVRERVTRRRGGVAVFDRIDPRRTAHIVVDLQNGFMAPGQVLETPMARTIVANVNRISRRLACRRRDSSLYIAHGGCGGGPHLAGPVESRPILACTTQ